MADKNVEQKKEMSKGLVFALGALVVLLFLILWIGGWVWGSYNLFITARQDIETQFSNIKTEYQRRADLFYNMAEIATGYADFEQETLTAVTQARGGNFQGTKGEQIQQLNALDG